MYTNRTMHTRFKPTFLSLCVSLLLIAAALIAIQSTAHAVKFRALGVGGCGNFADAVDLAQDGEGIAVMLGDNNTSGVLITKSLYIQGGWLPDFDQTSGCDEPNQTFTDTQDLLDAFFIYTPITPSGLNNSEDPVISLSLTGVLTLENVEIRQTTEVLNGGAISGTLWGGELLLNDTVISNSLASETGGGIFLDLRQGARLVISGSQLLANEADAGGGFDIRVYDNSEVIIHNSEIGANLAWAGGGGRIQVMDSGFITITDSVFWGNGTPAARDAGARAVAGEGHLHIVSSPQGSTHVCIENTMFNGTPFDKAGGIVMEGDNFEMCTDTSSVYLPELSNDWAPRRMSWIRDISIVSDYYAIEFGTDGYVPNLPNDYHVHFFFDTVPQSQAGVPGKGPWKLYGGPSPFTGWKVSQRPEGATQMCILVARPDHSIFRNSGNCVDLPG